ncbi:MAG: pyridoxamine 5'-phosphate oxidase family protein, partial [Gammaproteobacteria bacterium]|nr:pyridoxamine 5'-phosphate oxidase family protein [Gammaproteobacteria bacterium]
MTVSDERFADFTDTIDSVDQVREILGEPTEAVLAKVIDSIDDVCRGIIAKSPFMLVASSSRDGRVTISPKGDPAGFVRVLDDKRLAIPDRLGNRRADTFQNILENPHVGLIFLIPGKAETLRVNGEARLVRDAELLESMAVNGRVPNLALVVYAQELFMHCAKCVRRSKLWQPDQWPDVSKTASIAEAMVKHAKLDVTPEEYEESMRG